MKKLYLLSLLIFTVLSLAQADIPKTIHFQGRLTDLSGNPVGEGNPSITFRLWDAETSGTMLWTGTYDAAVKEGYYSVELGSGLHPFTGLTFNQPYYLDLKVGSDPDYLSPRIKLDSSAYAMNVADGAISTAKLADSSVIAAKISDSAITTAKIQDNAVTTAKINNGAVTTDKIADNGTSQIWNYAFDSRNHTTSEQYTVFDVNINLAKAAKIVILAKAEVSGHSATAGSVAWTLYWNDQFADYAFRGIHYTNDVNGATLMSVKGGAAGNQYNIKLKADVTIVNNPIETNFYKLIIQAFYK